MTPQFPRLFLWHVARYARQHKLLAGLNVCSVALGVSVYLAIQIANHSANQSFAASIDMVAGKANLEVRSPGGGFDETVFPKLAHANGVRAATPLVEGYATLPDFPGEYLQILGVDIFTNVPFSTFNIGGQAAAASSDLDPERWLGDPRTLAITDEFAREHHLKVGDAVRLQVNGREQSLTVRFLVRLADTAAGRGNSRVAAMDIGWAQELLGTVGRLSSIQLLLDRPQDATNVAAQLAKLVPPDVTITPPGQRSGQVERMLASFELNLSALSLISLLVGMFLIYNTVTASVVRRRIETGILRAIGMTRLEVHCLFLGEAFLFGILGVGAGIIGGMALARWLLAREIGRVISTLYLLVSTDRFDLTPLLLGSAFVVGLGSVLTAAWLPAREGANADPVMALSLGLGTTLEQGRRHTGRWLWAGVLALLLATGCAMGALLTGPAWLGFGSAFFVLLGFAFTTPALTTAGGRLVEMAVGGWSRPGWTRGSDRTPTAGDDGGNQSRLAAMSASFLTQLRLAAQNLKRSVHRDAVIVAALMAAIAMTVGISIMIHAFRRTVEIWIDRAITADIFMTPEANETLGNGAFFPPETLAALRRDPAVRVVNTVREIGVNYAGNRVSLVVVGGPRGDQLAFVGGGSTEKQAAFSLADHIFVSEPFAHKYHVEVGDHLPIATPDGVVNFSIAGVYYDYSRDSGIITITAENFSRHWHDDRVMSVALYLHDPTQLDSFAEHLRRAFNTHGEFLIFSNRAIRERVFEIFGQTFRITGVLRGIAVMVAIIGIFLTLTTLIAEREREIGTLRALGASALQTQGMILIESALIGILASIVGLIAGMALSVVLTYVINKAFFGWTIQFSVPWETVILTPVWIVGAALIAGWLPAIRAARIPIAKALRTE